MNSSSSRRAALAALSLGLLAPSAANAQSPHDPAAAEALFNDARELLAKDDWAGACTKFQASQELDPAPSTLVKLAKCREHEGKLAEAWYTLQAALKLNREKTDQSDKRRHDLESHTMLQIASIEPRVPRLRIVLKNAPPGVRALRDGLPQPVAALGEPLPADPGAHDVVVEAPGFTAERRSVSLAEGQTLDVTIELHQEAPTVASSTAPQPEAASGPGPAGSARRTAAFVVGGVGIAGLATGAVLGIMTVTEVGGAPKSGPARTNTLAAASANQTAGLVAAGLGAAALGTGIVLLVTAPKSTGPTATVSLGPNRIASTFTW